MYFLNLDNAFGMPILKIPLLAVSYGNELNFMLIIGAQLLHQNTQAHQDRPQQIQVDQTKKYVLIAPNENL